MVAGRARENRERLYIMSRSREDEVDCYIRVETDRTSLMVL